MRIADMRMAVAPTVRLTNLDLSMREKCVHVAYKLDYTCNIDPLFDSLRKIQQTSRNSENPRVNITVPLCLL